jgi:hypothetical protein
MDTHFEHQKLQRVELVRQHVVRGMARQLANLRVYLSMIDGNQFAVERLVGASGNEILGRVADLVMLELGDNSTAVDDGDAMRRGVARKLPKVRGRAAAAARGDGEDEDAEE